MSTRRSVVLGVIVVGIILVVYPSSDSGSAAATEAHIKALSNSLLEAERARQAAEATRQAAEAKRKAAALAVPPPPPPAPAGGPPPPSGGPPPPPPPTIPQMTGAMKQVSVEHLWTRPLNIMTDGAAASGPSSAGTVDTYLNVSNIGGKSIVYFTNRASQCPGMPQSGTLFGGSRLARDMLASVPRGGVAIDIGAGIGESAVPISGLLASHVIAIEANPDDFPILEFNARLNPELQIDAYQAAAVASATTTTASLSFDANRCGAGKRATAGDPTATSVAAIHVPTFVTETYGEGVVEALRLIKVRGDGNEATILKSLAPLVKRNKKLVVFVALPEAVSDATAIFEAAEGLGMLAFVPRTMEAASADDFKGGNLILIHKATKPWKANAWQEDSFDVAKRQGPQPEGWAAVKTPTGPAYSKPLTMGGLWSRPLLTHAAHALAQAPDYIDHIDAYGGVSASDGKSNVLFAYRKTPCPDWNREHPTKLMTENVMGAMLTSIPRGGVALDIGACYGDTAIPIASQIASRVIAFEPNPKSFAVLDFNAKMNPSLNIEAHNVAAAGDAKTTYLDFSYAGDMCNGGVTMKGLEWFQKHEFSVRVAATHIPTFLAKRYGEELFDEITFIKIDAEGFDEFILQTLQPILTRNPKIIIMIEWFDHFKTTDPDGVHPKSQTLFDLIDSMGYDIYEPYTMERIPGPQSRYKQPDVTLLKKGTAPWKPLISANKPLPLIPTDTHTRRR